MEYVSALSEFFKYKRAVFLCAKSVDYKFYEHIIIYNFITHIYLLF